MSPKAIVAALPLAPVLSTPDRLKDLLFSAASNLVAAVVILILGFVLSRWVGRWLERTLIHSRRIDATLVPVSTTTVRYGIIAVTLIAVLGRFGVQTTSLIAVLGAAGLAIGLALQGTLSNVAAGAMLLFLRPFRVGDYISAADTGGTVREIGLFTTVLIDADLIYISVPNSKLFSSTIINYSREPTRRINFTVGIDYEDDIEKAQAIILDLLTSDPRVLRDPPPATPVGSLGASSVDIIVRCWTATSDYWSVLYDLQKKVKLALDKAGITIPYPQHVVQFRDVSGGSLPAAPPQVQTKPQAAPPR